MSQAPLKSDLSTPNDPQAIPKLARSYAQNRSLGVVAFLFIFLLLFAGIYVGSYFAGEAYRSGNNLLLALSVTVLAVSIAGTFYVSVPRWGGKLQQRIMERLYASEGSAAFAPPNNTTNQWVFVLAIGYAACIIATVMLEFFVDVPARYVQPITAIYVVPFLVGLWFLMRPMVGPAALLWPALYAVHALLSLAGAPIVFTAPWGSLNILIPIVGYGLVAAFVGHFASRVALRRLKTLTRSDVTDSLAEGDHVGD